MARDPLAAEARDWPVGRGAAEVLRPLLHDLFACEAAARAGDPEDGIHDMRVAAKRTREAMRLFANAFRKKDAKKSLAWIEDLNDALGEVRDLDVLVERLKKRAAKVGKPEGLDSLIERLYRRREGARSWLAFRLDRVRDREQASKLEARLARLTAEAAPDDEKLDAFVRAEIARALERVRGRWERVRLAASARTFHRVRIANKRLRYAIEPFVGFLPATIGELYELSSKLHDELGDMHDEDELIRIVETEMACASHAHRAGWRALAEDCEARRRKILDETLVLADRLAGAEGWSRAETALRAEEVLAAGPAPIETVVAASAAEHPPK